MPMLTSRFRAGRRAGAALVLTAIAAAVSVPLSFGLAPAGAEAAEDGWITLFDGKSTDGWIKYSGGGPVTKPWVVEDGALVLTAGGGGDIATAEQFDDFELELEWKVTPGANSGIMYRVRGGDPAPYLSGPEYQILDDDKHADGRNPKTSAGSLYALIAPENKRLKPVGEWNATRIVLKGNHLEHWLNGEKVVETEMAGEAWDALVAGSKFNSWKQFAKSPRGHVVLQDHGDKVAYRNIRIRPIK